MLASRRVKRLLAARDFDALVGLLEHGSRRTRRAAARALGKLGDPRAVDPLSAALEAAYGEDEGLPPLIVTALGELNDPRTVDPLKRVLAERRDDTFYLWAQREALHALADLGEFEPIEEVARDTSRDAVLRSEAANLLRGGG
jgi:HEAT repeat protein